MDNTTTSSTSFTTTTTTTSLTGAGSTSYIGGGHIGYTFTSTPEVGSNIYDSNGNWVGKVQQ